MSTQSDRIEQYLRNTMTEEEKSAFQFELMQDKNLREEVKAMRIVQKTVIAESRQKAATGFNYRPLAYAAAVLLLLGAFFFLSKKSDDRIADDVPPKETETLPITPNDTSTEEEGIVVEEKEEKKLEDVINEGVKNKKEAVKEKPIQQIALADPIDLVPNPLFEQMTTGVRGGDIEIKAISPVKDAVLTWQEGAFVLPFRGIVNTDDEAAPTLNLLIFSNKKADFEEWKYLEKVSLKIEKSAAGFRYSARPKLNVKRGLYYYLIENEDTEEPVLTGKFEVK